MANVLYAEDDNDMSKVMVLWLERRAYKVTLVKNGLEALECLQFGRYDLVLLDHNLPEYDGVSVCRTFRETNKNTPVIMLTGGRDASAQAVGIAAGANSVLLKPPNLNVLSALIESLIAMQN